MSTKSLRRCMWVDPNFDLQREYHDNEWGVPVYDDKLLFEMLVLESFQAGISWVIILKKREAFRAALDNFDPVKISQYGEEKIQELLKNEKIVRSRAKINATISNAQIFLKVQKEFGSFANYLWGFTDHKIIKNMDDNIPTRTELSDRISKDMKKRGIKFMGSVTVYSYLAAVGIVNIHETRCYRYND